MTDVVGQDDVLARWAYTEVLSNEHGASYRNAGVPAELAEKAGRAVPFDQLDQDERRSLLSGWRAVRGVEAVTDLLQDISTFELKQWKRSDLAAVLVLRFFLRDVMSDSLVHRLRLPFDIWINAEPVRPLHQSHPRYAANRPGASQVDPLTVGRYADGALVLLDGYHRAAAFWSRTDPNAQLLVYVPTP